MDPRTEQTQTNIKNAFRKLIEEKPIAKISVSQICSAVGIPRQTFYYHYSDCQALVESVIEDETTRITELLMTPQDNTKACVEMQLRSLKENELFFHRLNEAGMRELLFSKLLDVARNNYFKEWGDLHDRFTQTEKELSFRFASAGLYEVLFDRNDGISEEERIDFIVKTIESHRRRIGLS